MKRLLFTNLLILLIGTNALLAQGVADQKFKLAESYEQAGKLEDAERIYLDLFNDAPKIKYLKSLYRVMIVQNKFSEILPIYDKYLSIEKNSDLISDYAVVLWKIGRYDESKISFQQAIDLAGKDQVQLEKIADKQISERCFNMAIETFLHIRKVMNQPFLNANRLSQLYTAIDDFSNAAIEIFKLFDSERNLAMVQGRLSALMNNSEAKSYIQNIIESKLANESMNLPLQQVYSWYLKSIGNYEKSLEVIKFVDDKSGGTGQFLIQFANDLRLEGKYDICIKALEHILNDKSKKTYHSSALYTYARTLESKLKSESNFTNSQILQILERYEKIEQENPNALLALESLFRIATLSIDYLNDKDHAINSLLEIQKRFSKNREAIEPGIYLGDIYLMDNNLDKAKEIYNELINKYARIAPEEIKKSQFRLAEIEYYQGNIDSAKSLFSQLALSTNNAISNDALKKSILIDNNKDFPTGLLKYSQAEYFLFSKDTANAIKLFEEASAKSIGSELAQSSLINISELLIATGKFQDAISNINSLLELYPRSIHAEKGQLLIGKSYELINNIDKAIEAYTKLIVDYPRSIYLIEARANIRRLRNESGS